MNSGLSLLQQIIDQSFQDDLFLDSSHLKPDEIKIYFEESISYLEKLQYAVKHQLDEETLYFKEKKRSSTVANLHNAFVRVISSLVRRRQHVEEELTALALDSSSTLILLLLKKAVESCAMVLEMLEDEYPNDINLDTDIAQARHGVLIAMHEPRYNALLRQFRLCPSFKEGLMAIVSELIHPFFDYEEIPTRRRFSVIRHFLSSLEASQRAKKRLVGSRTITARQVVAALIMAHHNDLFVVESLRQMLERHLEPQSMQQSISYLKSCLSFLRSMTPPRREGSSPDDASLWDQINKMLRQRLSEIEEAVAQRTVEDAPPISSKIKLGISVEAFALLSVLAAEARIIEGESQAGIARQLITQFTRQDGQALAEHSLIKRMSSPSEKAISEVRACLERLNAKLARREQLLKQVSGN